MLMEVELRAEAATSVGVPLGTAKRRKVDSCTNYTLRSLTLAVLN